jgi:hypothetical protein
MRATRRNSPWERMGVKLGSKSLKLKKKVSRLKGKMLCRLQNLLTDGGPSELYFRSKITFIDKKS